MEPRTKKIALEQCIELWDELAKTGSRRKDTACDYKYVGYEANCPCCEHVGIVARKRDLTEDWCKLCPLVQSGLWPWDESEHEDYEPCMDHDSVFHRWLRSSNNRENRKYFAKKIAAGARDALSRLNSRGRFEKK